MALPLAMDAPGRLIKATLPHFSDSEITPVPISHLVELWIPVMELASCLWQTVVASLSVPRHTRRRRARTTARRTYRTSSAWGACGSSSRPRQSCPDRRSSTTMTGHRWSLGLVYMQHQTFLSIMSHSIELLYSLLYILYFVSQSMALSTSICCMLYVYLFLHIVCLATPLWIFVI